MASRNARRFAAVAGVLAGLAVAAAALCAVSVSYADGAPIPAPLSSADPAVLASHTYLIDCEHQPVVRPASFVLTCADANSSIEPATWSVWGGPVARATGTYSENDCTPNCAAGTFHAYPVVMTAEDLAKADGTGHYRRISLRFTRDAPTWVKHRRTDFDVDFFGRG